MKTNSIKVVSVILCLIMLLGMIPMSASAAESSDPAVYGVPETMQKVSEEKTPLAPGVEETQYVVYDKNGDRVVYYVVNANMATDSTVEVKANYHDNDNTGVWGKATVVEQANAAIEKRGYNVVASTNAAYYNVGTGQPTGGFVMEGININGDEMGNQHPFFAVMKDGTAMIGQKGTFSQYSENIQEAVGGWEMLVWEGKNVANASDSSKYPRSTVGIKDNGDVVLMLADGNQSPVSIGLTKYEQAQIMIAQGCEYAVELDGGGSATYAAKPEGSSEIEVRNVCCDGTVRSVSNTLMVISNAVADGTFDHSIVSSDYYYYAPNSTAPFSAVGADAAGGPAEIPADATWSLSDTSFGTVSDGMFTSSGKLGTVDVQMEVNGVVVGKKSIEIVNPTSISFESSEKVLPYGKTTPLIVNAKNGLSDVYVVADSFDFTYSDDNAGTQKGFMFTATEDESKKSVTVTANYKYADIESTSIILNFGKGSDVLFTFEDADVSDWCDINGLKEQAENGKYTGGFTDVTDSNACGNEIQSGIKHNVFLASKETGGQVHSGDYSLGFTMDYRNSTAFSSWLYDYLYYTGDTIKYRDTENDIYGTRIGMWMYIPEEAVGSCARLSYTYKKDDGTMNVAYLYFTYMYVEKGFSKLTSEKIPAAGWAYVYCDLDAISKTFVSTAYYKNEDGTLVRDSLSNYAPAFIQWIISSSARGAEKCTFYIDDITLDYSNAVDDRDAPTISNVKYADESMSDAAALNGNTSTYNKINFAADVAEDMDHNPSGIDASSAAVYIDGQEIVCKYAANKITAQAVLPNGTHDVTFEISDIQGNVGKITKQIVINNPDSTYPSVTVTGQALSEGNLKTGAQYNILINADKVEAIDTIKTSIWLNSASNWALEHMTVAEGFEVSYELDELSCIADITIKRVDSKAKGDATLLTIPVYAYSWNGTPLDAYNQWFGNGSSPEVTLSYKVKSGEVTYTDGNKVTDNYYVSGFGNIRQNVTTELNTTCANLKNTIGVWHIHGTSEEVAPVIEKLSSNELALKNVSTTVSVEDKAATCTEDGYTGRTMCPDCGSIVDWGTTIPATGHNWQINDEGKLACDNDGELYNGEYNGNTYIDGVIADGWVTIDGDKYYYENGNKITGNYVIDKKVYVFDKNGVYQPDKNFSGFIDSSEGTMYFLDKDNYVEEYIYLVDTPYYFNNGIAVNGEYTINGETCIFEKGKYVSCSTADVLMAGWAGPKAYFILYSDGQFIFTGSGDMYYHQSKASLPWNKLIPSVKTVFIGKDITSIARFSFSHGYYIKDIVFEEGSKLETICFQAFHYVKTIKSIRLPDSVKTIEYGAFGYWSDLREIYIPDGVKYIHHNAFLNLKPSNITMYVAEGTYAHDYAVKYGYNVSLRERTPQIVDEGNCGDSVTWKLYDTGKLVIDGTGDMFDYTAEKAGASPWRPYLSQITSVEIGKDVTYIGAYAFYACRSMTSVTFEEECKLSTLGEGSFGCCEALKNVVLPASLKEIGKNAFSYCSGLETVSFEADSKLKTIGYTAFRDTTSLLSLYIPDGVTSIGPVILYHGNSETVISVADNTYAYNFIKNTGYKYETRERLPYVTNEGTLGETLTWELYDTGKLVIGGIGEMPDYTAAKAGASPWRPYLSKITSVEIGKDVTNIGAYAFYACRSMTSVTFEEGCKLSALGEGAFGCCEALKDVVLPASLKEIGKNAFSYCYGLETVSFEENSKLETLGSAAFRDTKVLSKLYLPDGVKSIGSVLLYHGNTDTVIIATENSTAYNYAVKNGYNVSTEG